MRLPEFSRASGVAGAEARKGGSPQKLSLKEDLKKVPFPKALGKYVARVSKDEKERLISYIRSFVEYLLNGEFLKVGVLLKEWDYESLKLFLPSITESEAVALHNYLVLLYQQALKIKHEREEWERILKTEPWEKCPDKRVEKKALKEFLTLLKAKQIRPKGYKWLPYRVVLFLDDKFQVQDARIYATIDTLNKYRAIAGRRKLNLLVQPNPVKIPAAFWKEYRKAKLPEQRVKVIQKYGLLKDENAVYITLVWDLDSPYEKVEPVFKEFLKDLDIKEKPFRVLLEKTASGRARLIILLYLRLDPTKEARNGHIHLENIKEALAIVAVYFQQKGINVDLTFIDRPNHQIWDRVAHPKKGEYKVEKAVATLHRIKFYDLYRRLKKLQREKELYYLKRGDKEINLTTYFGWRPEYRKTKKAKVLKVPKFVAERLNDRAIESLKEDLKLYYWKKAVKSLAERVSDHRYNRVIRPAVGWAKYLGLDYLEVESFLKEVLNRDTRKTEKDVQVAWREAPELEFKLPKGIRTLNFKTLVKEALRALAEGEISRQELIKVLGHQKWLTDLLTQAFEKVGLITSRFVKAGRGRPKKVFTLTEKGRLVAANLKEETLNELWRVAVGQDFSSTDFSQYKNSSSTSLKVVVGQNFAGPKKYQQDLINLTKNDDLRVYSAGGGTQIRIVAPEAEGPKPPENSPKVSEKPKEAAHPPKDEVSKAEEILRRLREGKPKRGGGISSLGEILGFD